MLKSLTERQKTLIVNNIVRACDDIEALNRNGYNFIYLANGFIAHYNLHGFKGYYSDTGNLRKDILLNEQDNMWMNFHPNDRDYDYYMSRVDVYKRIVQKLKKV